MPPLQLPALYHSAEQVSAESQQAFYRFKIAELTILALGAAAGLIATDWAGAVGPIIALICFVGAIGIQISQVTERAERRWYDARAAAESIKSASWQYAVGGEAFRLDDTEAADRYHQRLQEILNTLPTLDIGAAATHTARTTSPMDILRASSQSERCEQYKRERVAEQVEWYAKKAAWNKKRARIYRWFLIGVEMLAILVGLLHVRGVIDIDFLGVFAATAAGLIAWMQVKNYVFLAESYAVTSHEVNLVTDTLESPVEEGVWSQSVHDAEAAFSREHTMWFARRQGPHA